MLEGFLAALAAKLIEKLVSYLVSAITSFVKMQSDEAQRKKHVDKAKQGDNSDLEDFLNNPPSV